MTEMRISTQADFANLAVYERSGSRGKIARIVFTNREYDEGWRGFGAGLVLLLTLILVFAGMMGLPHMPFFSGELFMLFFVVAVAAIIGAGLNARQPWRIRRTIELDFGADALRILRNGRLEQERTLSRLANLTIEDHPEAEIERAERQKKGERFPRLKEKQHCLFGWFGAGGAEKVMLLSRAEWPSQHSLFEVRQAILWAIQRAAGPGAPDIMSEPQPRRAGGLNPPLD